MRAKPYIFFYLLLSFLVLISACQTSKKQNHTSKKPITKGISETDQTKFSFYFIEGCAERMKGNIEKSENLFKECLKLDPTSAAVKYELGNIYRYNGLYDIALKYGKECANEDQKNEWYQLLYIECLHNKRQYTQSADIYTRLIKNYPNRSEFYEGLAAEYMYAGNFEKSYKTFDDLEKKFGINETFTLNKIKLLKQLKKNTEAEVEFKKLIQTNPSEARNYTYLADFYQETNQDEKAMDTYNQVLKFDPTNPSVHLALADYYKAKNDPQNFYKEIKIAFENPDLEIETKLKILISYYEISETDELSKQQAYELCAITLKLHETSAEAYSMYGDFLYRDKKIKEARTEYEKALKIEKSDYSIWNQLMIIESELGEYASLELHSAETIELFPNQSLPYFFNSIANITLKNYAKAVVSLTDGLEFVNQNNPLLLQFYSNLGDAYNYLKEFTKSDKAFDDALKIDPDNSSILNNYAYYLSLRKDKLESAEKFSRRSNEIAPNNRSFIDTYGWILYQLGKYKEAEIWLSRAAKMGNKSAILLEHYGDVLYKLGKKDEALINWIDAKNTGAGSIFLDKKIEDKKLND